MNKHLSFVDVATGSLEQSLSCAACMAHTGKHFDKAGYQVYCFLGDGESDVGSVWEVLCFAVHYKLDNLVAILYVNCLAQSELTMFQYKLEVYRRRLESFGFNTIVIDGHNIETILKALETAKAVKGKPTAIVAKTYKRKGLAGIEGEENWCKKPLNVEAGEFIEGLLNSIKNNSPVSQVIKNSASDGDVISAGVALNEALEAVETYSKEGIHIPINDRFTIKPLDAATITAQAQECDGKILTVEDHYPKKEIHLDAIKKTLKASEELEKNLSALEAKCKDLEDVWASSKHENLKKRIEYYYNKAVKEFSDF